ncbi:hypothetical protein [Chitinophaga sp. CF418]|uniref:hypothetical protein n=1 Tax=Chitinophaga sp. CF418 TaxID=1855287 RepID=UPI000910D193|nr:hypothetical protein [Chitinophaga sp. CF418]SHN45512.1 hypothetical protein SAMN05216311_12084 [Chitinophaga sp. CF418]
MSQKETSKQIKLIFTGVLGLLVLLTIAYIIRGLAENTDGRNLRMFLATVVVLPSFFILVASFILGYLDNDALIFKFRKEKNKDQHSNMQLATIGDILCDLLKKKLADNLDAVDDETYGKYPTKEHIECLENGFVEQLIHDEKYAGTVRHLIELQQELKGQISRLIKNSNLNLVIGIVTTVMAILVLGLSIYYQQKMITTIDLLQYFIPRVSTVIFIEVFSFFFLRLYKNNLSEIKYFQNEITNLNFKLCALKSAIQLGDNETTASIILQFAATERNFILQKGQSTEKLELLKIEQKDNKNIADSIVNVVKTVKEN